jgi:hypothetical protein
MQQFTVSGFKMLYPGNMNCFIPECKISYPYMKQYIHGTWVQRFKHKYETTYPGTNRPQICIHSNLCNEVQLFSCHSDMSINFWVTGDRCCDFKNIFRWKIWRKNWRFLLKTKLNYAKIGSYHWFLRKTPIFFAEKWQKSQKIVIITSTPDWVNFRLLGNCSNLGNLVKITVRAQILGSFFVQKLCINFWQQWATFWAFFKESSGHPD